MGEISMRTSFLLSIYLEGWAYGFLFCMYAFTVYAKFAVKVLGREDTQASAMFMISTVMVLIATAHVSMNMFRLLKAFSDNCGKIHGPESYLGKINQWDHVLKDGLYTTQEILGNAAAVYRTWILWGKSWKIIMLPVLMLMGEIVAGYTTCYIFANVDPTHNIFDPRLHGFIWTFWGLSISLNIITTLLMAYRVWKTHKLSLSYGGGTKSRLLPIMWVLVESASLQLVIELVLLGLYSYHSHAQYVALELVTPFVGITFNAITIRLKLFAIEEEVHPLRSAESYPASTTVVSMQLQDMNTGYSEINANKAKAIHSPTSISHCNVAPPF